jgi:hypothetical protein
MGFLEYLIFSTSNTRFNKTPTKFPPRKNPANAAMNVYNNKSSDDIWFLLVVTPDKLPAVAVKKLGAILLLIPVHYSLLNL